MSLHDRIVVEGKCPPGQKMVFGKCRKPVSPSDVAAHMRKELGDGPWNPAAMMRAGKKLVKKVQEAKDESLSSRVRTWEAMLAHAVRAERDAKNGYAPEKNSAYARKQLETICDQITSYLKQISREKP